MWIKRGTKAFKNRSCHVSTTFYFNFISFNRLPYNILHTLKNISFQTFLFSDVESIFEIDLSFI